MTTQLSPSAMTYRQLQLAIKAIREDASCNISTPKLNSKKVVLIEWLEHHCAIATEGAKQTIATDKNLALAQQVMAEIKAAQRQLNTVTDEILAHIPALKTYWLQSKTEDLLAQYPLA